MQTSTPPTTHLCNEMAIVDALNACVVNKAMRELVYAMHSQIGASILVLANVGVEAVSRFLI